MPANRSGHAAIGLSSLFLASLVLFTDDYVIAGILPELARDLAVSEGLAGQLITVFSATVAIAAPLCAILLAGLGRKPLILAALLLFACANLLAAFASSFALLMAMRVAAALCAAATTPSLFAVAASMAPEGKAGRYIAVISLGVTGSIAFGVPLGTWIGAAFGWRWTFGCMAMGGLLAAIAIGRLLPRSERQPASDLKALLVPLMSRPLLLGFLANFLNMAASMMLLTYLAPVLLALGDIGPQQRGLVFGLSGFAGMAGVWLGGRAIDRRGAFRALIIGMTAFAIAMIGLTIFWALRPVPLPGMLVVVALWAGSAFWNAPAIAARIMGLAGGAAQQAMALNTSFTYLGVALGGILGGIVLDLAGVAFLAPVSLTLATLAVGVLHMSRGS
ncbi:MFS transporter (plasmid) [Paracoccus versutus]|uniref:MFS family arabinose efflux permease n=1 Tax=Paracoccus versutus TaxID=34007 RepID=A0AAQ0KL95_PARVE|nr:MFS transporter [Paracoccus versutus]REG45987.1 putative MFS family arabinose efflux permease [Paracoccus versutus]WEJ81377.1 MFS transporter [Paracoccus versutus]